MKKLLSVLLLLAMLLPSAAMADQVVNVFNWEDYIDESVLEMFTRETGIKVNQSKKYINSSVFTTHGTKFILYTDNVAPFECVVDNVVIDE